MTVRLDPVHLLGLALAVVALAVFPSGSSAAPGLILGVTDSQFRWQPESAGETARDLGLSAFRVRVDWSPGRTELTREDAANLTTMVRRAPGLRIVLTVAGSASEAPLDASSRDTYCSYVQSVLARFSAIRDVVVWNEPNLGYFWQPQFDASGASAAPAAYEALLARCWDVLHAFRSDVNVILTVSPSGNDNPSAASNVSHSPGTFLRKLGAAYRASGRRAPVFDTVGLNPYGLSSAESPSARHLGPSHLGEGDLDRLLQALDEGFVGTTQPLPRSCAGASSCPTIWYLEAGYQTVPDAVHQAAYFGRENDARPVLDSGAGGDLTQAQQLGDGIRLAYCQPFVGAFFNFLLWDERDLARWQSGVLWADGGRKASFAALQQLADDVRNGRIDCTRLGASAASSSRTAPDLLIDRLELVPTTEFSSFNEIWRFGVSARTYLLFQARIERLVPSRTGAVRRVQSLWMSGILRKGHPRVVQFAPEQLRPGHYRIVLLVTRPRPAATVVRLSPQFVVE